MVAAGDEIELDITDVAHGGVFIGRHIDADSADRGGRVVFVPDAVPGEKVRVRLTDTAKKSYWRGEVVEVISASEHRQPHVWAEADVTVAPESRAGGADFGHIDLAHQRRLKERVIRDALERFGGLELPVTMEGARPARDARGEVIAAESDAATRWRTRVSLHVDADGRVGPFAARSHRVVDMGDLPLATGEIAELARQRRSAAPGRIDFVQPSDGRVRIIARPEVQRREPSSSGARGRNGARGPRRGGAPARARPTIDPAAHETVIQDVAGRPFRVDAGGFWQVHRLAAQTLTEALVDALAEAGPDAVDPDAWHLDLYGGVGLLAAAVAGAAGPATRITTVESDPRATEHAGANLAEWVGARAETGRVDRWLAHLLDSASASERARLQRGVVVLDPPRAGAGREVVERISDLAPAHVAYVACDPVAMARDLATFRERGYAAQRIQGFDLFPHSHHVESVALLTREGPGR
jgi:tRNA/tmRNA/rRNA uracil-C5-methylase (TrmA/RlmC/RlmD family)